MLDVIALQARAEYKRHQYEQEAAYEHLLRQLRPSQAQQPAALPMRISQWGRLLLAGVVTAVLLIAVVPPPATETVEAMPAAPELAATIAPGIGSTAGPGCWITGDLVGEANPATVANMLCGS